MNKMTNILRLKVRIQSRDIAKMEVKEIKATFKGFYRLAKVLK